MALYRCPECRSFNVDLFDVSEGYEFAADSGDIQAAIEMDDLVAQFGDDIVMCNDCGHVCDAGSASL